jgi:dihydroorotate dehydrogenase
VATPILRYISNPEHAHHLAVQLLREYPQLALTHRPSAIEQSLTVEQTICGLKLENPIGLAAGFDKDAEGIPALLNLGFGFVEVGSVCLRSQPGNPSPRMFRLLEDDAIINRYGFNSQGAETVKTNLQLFRSGYAGNGLVGINLGKNKETETPLEDYQELIRELGPYADYLVINVSCPNLAGLQDLQSTDNLIYLLSGCDEARNQLEASTQTRRPPLFVKLSPDLDEEQLSALALALMEMKKQGKVDGIIVSNTTTERPHGLQSVHRTETGGLSGRPLTNKSTECIRFLYATTQGELPIIGVGGVFSAHDVMDKLKAGASAVQIYTGMVVQGPGLVSKIRHELAQQLRENGFRSIDQVIGLDHEGLYWQRRFRAVKIEQEREEHHQEGEHDVLVTGSTRG